MLDITGPAVGATADLPTQKPSKGNSIPAPRFGILTVPIKQLDDAPLVINAFSAKARQQMRDAQEAGAAGKKRRAKDPKDFEALYHAARHISKEGWDGAAAATFRNAMISACRLVAFKMTISKLSVFIIPDGISVADGTALVRISGEPEPFEATVRNQSGVADIRVRPRWHEWSANLRIKFDLDQFTVDDVINLLMRAGQQCGVCEGRPDSKESAGMGWGLFTIDAAKPVQFSEIKAPQIQFVTTAAVDDPAPRPKAKKRQ
jgi:hypothetical protein